MNSFGKIYYESVVDYSEGGWSCVHLEVVVTGVDSLDSISCHYDGLCNTFSDILLQNGW